MLLLPLLFFLRTSLGSNLDLGILFKWSSQIQNSCESWFQLSPLIDLEKSLICGTELKNLKLLTVFKKHSLFHLIVVSGSHFLWINKGLEIIHLRAPMRWTALFIYNFVTGFQAPGTRALIQICLAHCGIFSRMRSDQIVFLTGSFYLLLFPKEVLSISLLLSWTAALGLSITSCFFRFMPLVKRLFFRQFLFFILIYPWLWGWGNSHPLTLFSNLLLGPLIMGLLLPYSLADLIIQFPIPLNQVIFSFVDNTLTALGDSHSTHASLPIQKDFFWFYLFFLHGLQHFLETCRKKELH